MLNQSPRPLHVLLICGGHAWGRGLTAMLLARQLLALGHQVQTFYSGPIDRILAGLDCPCEGLPNVPGPLLTLYLEELVAELRPSTLILCDGMSVANYLLPSGIDPAILMRWDVRVVGLDTWNSAESGTKADLFLDKTLNIPRWWEEVDRLVPVPPSRPTPTPPMERHWTCNFLPDRPACAGARRKLEVLLNLRPGDHCALLTTAPWQHEELFDRNGAAVQRLVPRLIAAAICQIPSLHLIHVGPAPLPLIPLLGDRYHWLATLAPPTFARLVAAQDLYLSLNPMATTQTLALISGVPVLRIENSTVRTWKELPELGDSEAVLYPFTIWPLGYRLFLSPVLKGNPLLDSMSVVELLEHTKLVQLLEVLVFDPVTRRNALEHQNHYVETISRLPHPGQVISHLIEDRTRL